MWGTCGRRRARCWRRRRSRVSRRRVGSRCRSRRRWRSRRTRRTWSSYFAPNGHYAVDEQRSRGGGRQCAAARAGERRVGWERRLPLRAELGVPDRDLPATNYWVDVVFTDGAAAPDTTAPTVTVDDAGLGCDRCDDGGGADRDVQRGGAAGDGVVHAPRRRERGGRRDSTLLQRRTQTATFMPSAPLATDSGVHGDGVGRPGHRRATRWRADDVVVHDRGVTGDASRASSPSGVTPVVSASGDTGAVELGVKFRSDVAGFVTGVRFYKGAGNTGTHVGNLWSASGTLLATATFSGESASGWQQVSFSSPVAVTANTTYVVSYFAPNGHYAVDNDLLHRRPGSTTARCTRLVHGRGRRERRLPVRRELGLPDRELPGVELLGRRRVLGVLTERALRVVASGGVGLVGRSTEVVGSSRVTTVPPPAATAASTVPPCSSMTPRTIERPRPEPGHRAGRRRAVEAVEHVGEVGSARCRVRGRGS